jgi:hypothetical protein
VQYTFCQYFFISVQIQGYIARLFSIEIEKRVISPRSVGPREITLSRFNNEIDQNETKRNGTEQNKMKRKWANRGANVYPN